MKTTDTRSRRLTPLLTPWCVTLALAAGGGAAFTLWLTLLPLSRERPGVTVSAKRDTLGMCLRRTLQTAPEFASAAGRRAVQPPLVSILTHPGSDSSRVVFEGNTRLAFVVTLTDMPDGQTETRLQMMPSLDPGPAVDRAVATCAAHKG